MCRVIRCDLSEISYLCTVNHTILCRRPSRHTVVICLKFLIFAPWITPWGWRYLQVVALWFVWNFLSLHRESHQGCITLKLELCCDLSEISYLCTVNHTHHQIPNGNCGVVICLKFLIFAPWITPARLARIAKSELWFVWNFLSLHRESHQRYTL